MKISCYIALCLLPVALLGQQTLPVQHDTLFEKGSFKHELILSGIADYNANALENELMKKLLYGGQITDGIKNRSFGNQRSVNRFGADVSAELEYRNYHVTPFKNERLGIVIKGGYYNYASLIYSKDLYGLAFYGNEKYLGQTASFSGTRFTGMSFQKVGFGFFDKVTKNSVSLNVYSISNFAEANIYAGQLFQSDKVDSVSLTLNGNATYASSNQYIKGLGAGIDLDFRLPVQVSETKTAIIRFEAKNLGFCSFVDKVTNYQADSTVHFSGYTLDQLQQSTSKLSLMDTLGIHKSLITKWRFLPAYFQVGKIVSDNDPSAVQTFYGIRMYGLSAYAPMVYAGLHYKLAKWADLGMSVMTGGFGRLRFGLYSNYRVGKCTLSVGSENVAGIFQKSALGESISIRLRCLF